MKLRNKKTGEIVEARSSFSTTDTIAIYYEEYDGQVGTRDRFKTLAELNEEWEDYEPTEPLIKDEKVRKAIRAWADAVGTDKAYLHLEHEEGSTFYVYNLMFDCHFIQIAFHNKNPIECERIYTITELCGEDEE